LQNEKQIDCTTLFHVVFAKPIFMGRKKIKALSNLNNGFKLTALRNLLLAKKLTA